MIFIDKIYKKSVKNRHVKIWLFQKSVVSLYYKIKKTKNPKK